MRLDKDTRKLLLVAGSGLIVVGIAPTPDDVTIVSPVAQIAMGLALITASVFL